MQGVRGIMALAGNAGIGVRATDGKLMWRYGNVANNTANITTPVFSDNKVLFTSAYGTGAALLGLTAQGGEVKAQELYFTRELQNHHGGVVLVNGYVYGFNNSILTCLDFNTGNTMWRHRSVGKGSLTCVGDKLYLYDERKGEAVLIDASPAGWNEHGRFKIDPQTTQRSGSGGIWTHPVVANGRLYLRDQELLAAYDVTSQ